MRRHGYSVGDRAPVGNTCPSIDSIIEMLAATADRVETIASQIDSAEFSALVDDLTAQAEILRDVFTSRRSALEELRADNDQLRQWGNKESVRADEAEAQIQSLRQQISELESI